MMTDAIWSEDSNRGDTYDVLEAIEDAQEAGLPVTVLVGEARLEVHIAGQAAYFIKLEDALMALAMALGPDEIEDLEEESE